jgi:hypothetical protein
VKRAVIHQVLALDPFSLEELRRFSAVCRSFMEEYRAVAYADEGSEAVGAEILKEVDERQTLE